MRITLRSFLWGVISLRDYILWVFSLRIMFTSLLRCCCGQDPQGTVDWYSLALQEGLCRPAGIEIRYLVIPNDLYLFVFEGTWAFSIAKWWQLYRSCNSLSPVTASVVTLCLFLVVGDWTCRPPWSRSGM